MKSYSIFVSSDRPVQPHPVTGHGADFERASVPKAGRTVVLHGAGVPCARLQLLVAETAGRTEGGRLVSTFLGPGNIEIWRRKLSMFSFCSATQR